MLKFFLCGTKENLTLCVRWNQVRFALRVWKQGKLCVGNLRAGGVNSLNCHFLRHVGPRACLAKPPLSDRADKVLSLRSV